MKDVCIDEKIDKSFMLVRKLPLLNYWKRIVLYKFIKQTYVSLPLTSSNLKESWSLYYIKK